MRLPFIWVFTILTVFKAVSVANLAPISAFSTEVLIENFPVRITPESAPALKAIKAPAPPSILRKTNNKAPPTSPPPKGNSSGWSS